MFHFNKYTKPLNGGNRWYPATAPFASRVSSSLWIYILQKVHCEERNRRHIKEYLILQCIKSRHLWIGMLTVLESNLDQSRKPISWESSTFRSSLWRAGSYCAAAAGHVTWCFVRARFPGELLPTYSSFCWGSRPWSWPSPCGKPSRWSNPAVRKFLEQIRVWWRL